MIFVLFSFHHPHPQHHHHSLSVSPFSRSVFIIVDLLLPCSRLQLAALLNSNLFYQHLLSSIPRPWLLVATPYAHRVRDLRNSLKRHDIEESGDISFRPLPDDIGDSGDVYFRRKKRDMTSIKLETFPRALTR